jgi:hypothetical protein
MWARNLLMAWRLSYDELFSYTLSLQATFLSDTRQSVETLHTATFHIVVNAPEDYL